MKLKNTINLHTKLLRGLNKLISEEGKIIFYAQKKYRNAGSKSISVRFSDDSINKIEEICSRTGKLRSDVVRMLVEDALDLVEIVTPD